LADDDVCEGRKALSGLGPPKPEKEDDMKLITQFEAAKLSTVQLYGLRKEAFIALGVLPKGSRSQRNALASMQAIEKELSLRGCAPY
jgi:hypothetical protein